MNDIEIIKMLLDIEESSNKNETIRNKIREILDGMGEQPPTAVMTQDSIKIGPPALTDSITPAATKPPKDEPQKLLRSKEVIGKTNRGGAKSTFDTGKLMALRSAGWSIKAIAEEMRCTEQTIRNHMKKEGIKYWCGCQKKESASSAARRSC